eukprot:SAG31_NODE_43419_length_267_cov_0.619048_1_plen_70_part_01
MRVARAPGMEPERVARTLFPRESEPDGLAADPVANAQQAAAKLVEGRRVAGVASPMARAQELADASNSDD